MSDSKHVCPVCGTSFTLTRYERNGRRYRGTLTAAPACSQACSMRGRVFANDAYRRHEQNPNACFYCMVSPENVRHIFRNAANFVREHSALFTPDELQPAKSGRRRADGSHCPSDTRASAGLRSLFYQSKKYRNADQWHGWRAIWKKDPLGRVVWERSESVKPVTPPDEAGE